MKLTNPPRIQSDDSFPTTQLFIIAICRVAEPIALTSIFPYAWLMVRDFRVGDQKDDCFYAGILISAFALAESLTAMWWGGLSDRIGRKPVLLLGCFGTILSLLVVGFSQNFTMALIGRILGGTLNGNIGVIQTMVGELVKKQEHEPKAYSIMPFVWSIGTIIGPAIGGLFADPVKNFPHWFRKDSLFEAYPWLLPNLLCAALMLCSIIASYIYLEETHPDLCMQSESIARSDAAERAPMIANVETNTDFAAVQRHGLYGTFTEDVQRDGYQHTHMVRPAEASILSEKTRSTSWFTWNVAMLCIALGIFTYHSMCYDHLLPIFLQDEQSDNISMLTSRSLFRIAGGLGLSTKVVGLIMSVNGMIALFVQAVIFPVVAEKLGVWRVFLLVTILHPMAYFIVPYTTMLPGNMLFPGIYVCLTIRNVLSIMAYPVILILLKQASPSPSVMGKINGLAASVGAGCRTIAPPVAGLLYGWGHELGFVGFAWWGAGTVALFGTAQLYFISRQKDPSILEPLASASSEEQAIISAKDVVQITVLKVDGSV